MEGVTCPCVDVKCADVESDPVMAKRKGARQMAEIPKAMLDKLNRGQAESANLVEWLAVDPCKLVGHVLPELGLECDVEPICEALHAYDKLTSIKAARTISEMLLVRIPSNQAGLSICQQMALHPSDTVRSWACFVIGGHRTQTLKQKLKRMEPLAADAHFGVRETAWLALRPALAANLESAIEQLTVWAGDVDENIRRFASEATRPRGVWTAHLTVLKENPALALPILEPLKADESKYVRDSVGNWLNDASKTCPNWVRELAARWEAQSPVSQTQAILKKGLRTLEKAP